MANYFSTRNNNQPKKDELRKALAALTLEEKTAHKEYLDSVCNLVTNKPGLTAKQYANMLSDNNEERNSIKISISMMGYMAKKAQNKNNSICNTPSIPNLERVIKTITRRFVEIDANNNPLGTVEYQETKFVYYMD